MRANVKNSLNYIRKITDFVPDVALILGSGLGGFTKTMEEVVCSIPYNRIPGFPVSTVSGHAGKYVMGYIKGVPVICMEGRVHYYEGYTPEEVVLPVRVMRALGAKVLFITNAAGGISEDLQPGSLVVLRDHVSMFVPNPLRGANDPDEGERFPDMTEVYDRFLRRTIEDCAARAGNCLRDRCSGGHDLAADAADLIAGIPFFIEGGVLRVPDIELVESMLTDKGYTTL